ncbi:hypothetical protein F2P56_003891 [Juglans regia]|uniref:Tubulin-specific chaperone A n=1 Tax=Juglans regia TaxID=51240 RepID=A0A834D5L8_JUGRE|nr:hypothetical protein F2P56_003891 [Juglans regia]
MATIRNLKIKSGTCKRIIKELHSYEKEVEREAAKTADMKEKGADPYDLKQQQNVLAESRMMIPDCRKRLEASLADLKGTLVLCLYFLVCILKITVYCFHSRSCGLNLLLERYIDETDEASSWHGGSLVAGIELYCLAISGIA